MLYDDLPQDNKYISSLIENHRSINEIIPKNILYFNKKYYLKNIKNQKTLEK